MFLLSWFIIYIAVYGGLNSIGKVGSYHCYGTHFKRKQTLMTACAVLKKGTFCPETWPVFSQGIYVLACMEVGVM